MDFFDDATTKMQATSKQTNAAVWDEIHDCGRTYSPLIYAWQVSGTVNWRGTTLITFDLEVICVKILLFFNSSLIGL